MRKFQFRAIGVLALLVGSMSFGVAISQAEEAKLGSLGSVHASRVSAPTVNPVMYCQGESAPSYKAVVKGLPADQGPYTISWDASVHYVDAGASQTGLDPFTAYPVNGIIETPVYQSGAVMPHLQLKQFIATANVKNFNGLSVAHSTAHCDY